METPVFNVLTQEQFDALLGDRDQAIAREKRALELAEQLTSQNVALLSGLVFYTKQQVADMLNCSTKQVERYEQKGLNRTPIGEGTKALYSIASLKAFIERYQVEDVKLTSTPSDYPTRRRQRA